MAREIELKLLVDARDIPRLLRHRLLKAQSVSKNLLSIYYDTPGLELHSRKIALRVRRSGSRWIQTIKDGGAVVAGLHSRGEWECEVAKKTPDLTRIDEPVLLEIFAGIRDKLQPAFVTEFSRVSRVVDFEGATIEFCLDRGEVVANERTLPICEVELELQSGSPAKLFALALALMETISLRIENISKAERGYALYRERSPHQVVKAAATMISGKMNLEQAFREILGNCLMQLQVNAQGISAAEEDPEYVHQMRVALRRMRSAFSVFSFAFAKVDEPFFLQEMKWLGQELGPAREWDVFALETLPSIGARLEKLEIEAGKMRQSTLTRARCAVDQGRYHAFLLRLGALLFEDSIFRQKVAENVPEFAVKILKKRRRRLHEQGENIATLSETALHELRIAAKKLRYAAEFFAPLYPAKASRPYLSALTALQNDLGAINDAFTTTALLDQLQLPLPDEVSYVVNCMNGRSEKQKAALPGLWRRLESTPVFW